MTAGTSLRGTGGPRGASDDRTTGGRACQGLPLLVDLTINPNPNPNPTLTLTFSSTSRFTWRSRRLVLVTAGTLHIGLPLLFDLALLALGAPREREQPCHEMTRDVALSAPVSCDPLSLWQVRRERERTAAGPSVSLEPQEEMQQEGEEKAEGQQEEEKRKRDALVEEMHRRTRECFVLDQPVVSVSGHPPVAAPKDEL